MRLIRAAKHIGQNAEKFRFDLRIENLYICLHEECEISVDWVRGPKRISGKESVSCVNGCIIHPFYQPLILIATLFQKSGKASKVKQTDDFFLPKDSRLVVYGKYKENPMPTIIGEVPLELSCYANGSKSKEAQDGTQIHIEVPLIKCSDPNSYIEAYISCTSLGQVSEGFDDTASMMSGFTTVYSDICELPLKQPEMKIGLDSFLFGKDDDGNKGLDSGREKRFPSEYTLGIPMFSIREDVEFQGDSHNARNETEEMTETGTVIDNINIENENSNFSEEKRLNTSEHVAPSYYQNPVIINSSYSHNTSEAQNSNSAVGVNAVSSRRSRSNSNNKDNNGCSSQSSPSFDLLTQRLNMEQEEYRRRINECNMEIKSLKQQLQIYSEQEKNWKQREADLMDEIKQLRTNDGSELLLNKEERSLDSKTQKVVDLNDYCLLQQEVSELTGVRDELRRLRESDKYNYEKYISALENQLDDVKRQLEHYQRTGKIQDEVEAEIFSISKNSHCNNGSYSTANSHVSDNEVNRPFVPRANSVENSGNTRTNRESQRNTKFSYCYDEIEKELISTKLALAQTETNYQIEINNLKSKLDKQKKQLLSYSSYVGNLEVINADLRYGSKSMPSNSDCRADENLVQCIEGSDNALDTVAVSVKSRNNANAIHYYWKTLKQRIKQ